MRVCYDCTRLIARLQDAHKTGICRVSWTYARWLYANADEFVGLVQMREGFRIIPSAMMDYLVNEHEAEPGGAGDFPQDLKRLIREFTQENRWALLEKFSHLDFTSIYRERGILAALASRWPGLSGSVDFPAGDWAGWTYVNVAHCFRSEGAIRSIPDRMQRLYFLQDIIPLTHPETQRASDRNLFLRMCRQFDHPRSTIAVSSHSTVQAIAAYSQGDATCTLDAGSLHVLPLAVDDHFVGRCCQPLEPPYFLSVGTIEARKNLALLVAVWERLIESGDPGPKLIWVGRFSWLADEGLMSRLRRLEAAGCADLRTDVSDSSLIQLMEGARALLFPSKVEGWGLPLSEALAMGLPSIVSDIPVFREVGQGIPELLDPEDVTAWKKQVLRYADARSPARMAQLERLEKYRPPTWEAHFEQFRALIDGSNE